MKTPIIAAALAAIGAVALGGCATPPSYPTVAALPGKYKPQDQYRADDVECRNYASAAIGAVGGYYPPRDRQVESAVAGTVFGAATGALIGAATHDAGPGAAIGAGLGLLFGSLAASPPPGYVDLYEQQRYDAAYLQCMYARGNQVPVRRVYRVGPPAPAVTPDRPPRAFIPAPAESAPPPAASPPPPGYVPAPAGTQPPPGYVVAPPPPARLY